MKNIETKEVLKKMAMKSLPRYTSYPTAPEWMDSTNDSVLYSRLKTVKHQQKGLALYIHIPFCQQQCWYCGCNTIIKKKSEHADKYLEYLFKEIDLILHHAAQNIKVVQMHWGGGTPNFLSEQQLDRLIGKLNDSFDIDWKGEISIEIDPRTCRPDKLRYLRKIGFNRVSMGIQDFHPEVQKAINRIQSYELVEELVKTAREVGFTSVNFDLVYGLPFQTLENFVETLDKTLSLKPDRLALYSFAYLPQLRPHMKLIKSQDLPEPDDKLGLFLQGREAFLNHGYVEIAMDHFAQKDDELAVAFNEGRLKRNFMGYTTQNVEDSLGLGTSSISYVGHAYIQNEREVKDYYAALDRNLVPVARVKVLDHDDLIRKWVIQELMCNLRVSKDVFKELFHEDFEKYFHVEKEFIDELAAQGIVKNSVQELHVEDSGRLLIRYICSGFDSYFRKNSRLFSSLV